MSLTLTIAGMVSFPALGQNGEIKKEWKFPSSHGELAIMASSFPNDSGVRFVSIHIYPTVWGSWTAAEETGPLESVLDAFPKAGFDTQRLSFMQLRLQEPDAQKLVAEQAALSKIWRSAVKTRRPAKTYPLVVDFINQSGAYSEWNDAFRERGLQLKAVGIEELGLQPFSKSGAKCPTGVNCANLLVPNDALVQINIVPRSLN
jgi:hypothetical protein